MQGLDESKVSRGQQDDSTTAPLIVTFRFGTYSKREQLRDYLAAIPPSNLPGHGVGIGELHRTGQDLLGYAVAVWQFLQDFQPVTERKKKGR